MNTETRPALWHRSWRFVRNEMASGRVPLGPIVLAAIASFGLFAFLEIADEVDDGETERIDQAILLALRVPGDSSQTIGPNWLHEAAVEYTALGGIPVIILVVLTVLGLLTLRREWGTALFVLASVIGGGTLAFVLKEVYGRPRPQVVEGFDAVQTLSFPSAHAMISSVTLLSVAVVIIRMTKSRSARVYVFACAVFYILLIGVTRVYLGVHYPSDVLAGWLLGSAWACLCWIVLSLIHRWRTGTLFQASR